VTHTADHEFEEYVTIKIMNTTLSISMPNELKQSLQAQVTAGRFKSLSAAIVAGAKRIVKVQKKDESWVTDDLVKRVKMAEREPIKRDREWDGDGSFTQFVVSDNRLNSF